MLKLKYIVLFFLIGIPCMVISQHCIPSRYAETALFDSSEIVVTNEIEYGLATHYFTGQNTSLRMDVYYPDPEIDALAKRPFILNIHGGGFAGGDKNELAYESMEFARRGFVVANINYRIGWNCDNVICFNCYAGNLQKAVYCAVQDVRAALRYAFDQKEEWKIDEEWMFVSGESAGSIAGMLSTFWNQSEAEAQVPAGFSNEVGSLNATGNNLPNGYEIKAIVDQCGAIAELDDMDDNQQIPVISFHDSNDCVVPYDSGPVIACFCGGFLNYHGSHAIYQYRLAAGQCSELHTAPQPFLPNHCTYPKPNIVKLASCFLKRVMCGFCMNFADDDITATPVCAATSSTINETEGCTYVQASNYNAQATRDDGSCIFPAATCPADLNTDGLVTVSDLILFIGAFGMVCE